MRWHLMTTFDEIYVLDLHGNANKKEISPDGTPDKNVFDIRQGVAIIIAVKSNAYDKKKPLAKVYHAELWGSRDNKYKSLETGSLNKINYKKLDTPAPFYFFIPQNYDAKAEYESGFALASLFISNVTGIVTARDGLVTALTKKELVKRMEVFSDPSRTDSEIRHEFFGNKKADKYLPGDTRGWKLSEARKKIKDFNHEEKIETICYRPFDDRPIYYIPEMIDWGREDFMSNFLSGKNIGLILSKRVEIPEFSHIFVSSLMIQHHTMSLKEVNISFPLYTYEKIGALEEKRPQS
jgi:predicted helicase